MKSRPGCLKVSGHEVGWLLRRWETLARRTGWQYRELLEVDGFPLLVLTRGNWADGGVYLSAGIHGDEPAGPLGLLEWADGDLRGFASRSGIIFPCLNPWGLMQNSRCDRSGTDLNRIWHRMEHPVIGCIRSFLGNARFSLALNLHEDFDARGIYVYEPWNGRRGEDAWGGWLLEKAARYLPVDSRRMIDGRRVTRPGYFHRRVREADFVDFGWPEAICLHLRHARRSFTFETPSEYGLDHRVASQAAFVRGALELADAERVSGLPRMRGRGK